MGNIDRLYITLATVRQMQGKKFTINLTLKSQT
jgi:hypothetical protein